MAGRDAAYWEDRLHVNLRHQFFAIQRGAGDAAAGKVDHQFRIDFVHLGMGECRLHDIQAGVEGLTRSFARDLGGDAFG